eukprot:gene10245-11946_t
MSNTNFEESYLLAEDNVAKETLLAGLIAGSQDYYYYTMLHLLNRLSNRATLLSYTPARSKKIFETIRKHLGLNFNYTSTAASLSLPDNDTTQDSAPPTTLSPLLIDRKTVINQYLDDSKDMSSFNHSAHAYIANEYTLTPAQRKEVLSLLTYPTLDHMVEHILAVKNPESLGLIGNLTSAQLQALAKARPKMVDSKFVSYQISKLVPSSSKDWQSESGTSLTFYRSAFALVTLIATNIYDTKLFATYAALPRGTHFYLPEVTEDQSGFVQFNFNISGDIDIPSVSPTDDESLIRMFLLRTLSTESMPPKDLSEIFRPSFLNPLFAEAKLLTNTLANRDAEKCYQMIDNHSLVAALKERVDIEFAPHNPVYFRPDGPVDLSCAVKNVQHLVIKLFEINTFNYYKEEMKEIDCNINLDGLVANQEFNYTYTEPSIRSVQRTYSFPTLNGKRGIFVLEFIGNGKSSRALIRKGELNYITGINQNGQLIKVIDEDSIKVTKSSVRVDGNTYTSDGNGDITVPFSAHQSNKSIILMTEGFASLKKFDHKSEDYQLEGGIFLDSSLFMPGERAPIIVRARLFLGGTQIPLSYLEDTMLTISTSDNSKEEIEIFKEVKPFALKDQQESTYHFKVPENVRSVTVKFDARIKILGGGGVSHETLTFTNDVLIISSPISDRISTYHLRNTPDGYKIYMLGKADNNGIVHLGPLKDIEELEVESGSDEQHLFSLNRHDYKYPTKIHARSNEMISIPYFGDDKRVSRSMFNLFEMVNKVVTRDLFDSMKFDKDRINIQFKLAPGQYIFMMSNPSETISIEVCDGDVREGFIVGPSRVLSYHPSLVHSLNLSASVDDTNLTVKLQNHTPNTRVHVCASYFETVDTMSKAFSVGDNPVLCQDICKVESTYFSGRQLGDEVTYIFNRRHIKSTMPGNSLKKPSNLLSPWAVADTNQSSESLKKGDSVANRRLYKSYGREGCKRHRAVLKGHTELPHSSFQEFLASPTSVILNLVPSANGSVVLPLSSLPSVVAGASSIKVTAVDYDTVISRHVSIVPKSSIQLKDTTLVRALDPSLHYTERKLITTVIPGCEPQFAIQNADSAKFTVYDTLSKVMALAKSVKPSPNLQEFSFITEWSTLNREAKNDKFSRFYCHELALFLQRKDRVFFDSVVRPFVAAKMHKTFIDHYLVGNSMALEKYTRSPAQFTKLNTLEKVLLAEMFPGSAVMIARAISDAVDYQPLNPVRYDTLFKFSLNLDVDKPKTLEDDINQLPEDFRDLCDDEDEDEDEDDEDYEDEEDDEDEDEEDDDEEYYNNQKIDIIRSAQLTPRKIRELSLRSKPFCLSSCSARSKSKSKRVAPAIYKQIEKTDELAETNYYKQLDTNTDLVSCNEFWRDYANHIATGAKTPFISKYIALIATSFTATIAGLAVIDLPFSSKNKEAINHNGVVKFSPTTPLIVFHQELAISPLEADTCLLVSQHFFDPSNSQSHDNGESSHIYISDEFLSSTVYKALVVVANLSSKKRKLEVLLQIPHGSVPVGSHPFYTTSRSCVLEPYSTQQFKYSFYFPAPGKYQHFTAQVTEKDRVVACVPPSPLVVVSKPTITNKLSWKYIANHGNMEQILEHLERENLHRTPLEYLYPRLSDAVFWRKVVQVLSAKGFYDRTTWSFSLLHNDDHYAADYLNDDSTSIDVGDSITSTLLTRDPIAQRTFHHLEYAPLVNSRAHQIGSQRKILNDKLYTQYKSFCRMLSYTANPSDIDLMSLVYYLLAQDRFEEAISTMKRIGQSFDTDDKKRKKIERQRVSPRSIKKSKTDSSSTGSASDPMDIEDDQQDDICIDISSFMPPSCLPEMQIQYEYLLSYLDFFNANPTHARQLAEKYKTYPVSRWRTLFQDMHNKIQQITNQATIDVDQSENDRERRHRSMTSSEPSFDISLEPDRCISVIHNNLSDITINYYIMDIELLFSTSPFVQHQSGSNHFLYISPNKSESFPLLEKNGTQSFPIPKEFANSNILIDCTSSGIHHNLTVYSNNLSVQITEKAGQLRIIQKMSKSPISKSYVKVYQKSKTGSVSFWKDGYTDIAGYFDYSSVSSGNLSDVSKFSILIIHKEHGAVIKEAKPPGM